MLRGPRSLQGLQLPGRRVSTGPVFIIQRGLYFDLGARLIIAYNAQGETRHHLTVAADSLPAGWDAIWALGRERRGSCPCPGVLGTNMSTQAPPQPAEGPGFSCSEVGLTTLYQLSISLPPRSPPATRGQPTGHPTERISKEQTCQEVGGAHGRMLGKSLRLPDLRFPSCSLTASCWPRNDRMLKVGLSQKHSPPRRSQVSDATSAQWALETPGRARFLDGSCTQLC